MCRRTGWQDAAPLPEKYPADYFKRLPLQSSFVQAVINQLKEDDIYQMNRIFSAAEH